MEAFCMLFILNNWKPNFFFICWHFKKLLLWKHLSDFHGTSGCTVKVSKTMGNLVQKLMVQL